MAYDLTETHFSSLEIELYFVHACYNGLNGIWLTDYNQSNLNI